VLASGEVYDFLPEQMAEDAGAFELKGVEGVVRCFRLVLGTPSQTSLAIH
jgi:class 3 adenylate cyclase